MVTKTKGRNGNNNNNGNYQGNNAQHRVNGNNNRDYQSNDWNGNNNGNYQGNNAHQRVNGNNNRNSQNNGGNGYNNGNYQRNNAQQRGNGNYNNYNNNRNGNRGNQHGNGNQRQNNQRRNNNDDNSMSSDPNSGCPNCGNHRGDPVNNSWRGESARVLNNIEQRRRQAASTRQARPFNPADYPFNTAIRNNGFAERNFKEALDRRRYYDSLNWPKDLDGDLIMVDALTQQPVWFVGPWRNPCLFIPMNPAPMDVEDWALHETLAGDDVDDDL
ncbi:hypothetical protein SLS58_002967 [Diplodia intermedia]|uniref:Uncharacterized protein n=1 Tax=Diplodia intermedia TaxID=856260 RepID=A0ABR3TY00_9PEZI